MPKLIIRISFMIAGLVLSMACAAEERLPANRLQVVRGKSDQICQALAKQLRRISQTELRDGSWRKLLESMPWQYERISTQDYELGLEYSSFDIDNDGTPEVIVARTYSFHQSDIESWYVLSQEQFEKLPRDQFVEKYLGEYFSLNSGANRDHLLFAFDVNPVQIVGWKFKHLNYVLLKEYGFGSRRGRLNSLVVMTVKKTPPGTMEPPRNTYRAKVVCRIRG